MQCLVISKRFGTWLSCLYLFMKFLYLTNAVGQIYLMQTFLQINSHEEYSSNFGIEITNNIIRGRNWEATGIFPRVTYCLARVKQLASVNTVTAQCVLTANLFIEKIYIFLWFWVMVIVILTSISLITWIFRLFLPSRSINEIKKHLRLYGHDIKPSESVESFCVNFLRLDGMFLLYMININAGDLTTGSLVSELFTTYQEKYQKHNFLQDDHFSACKTVDNYKLLKMKAAEQ